MNALQIIAVSLFLLLALIGTVFFELRAQLYRLRRRVADLESRGDHHAER